MRSPGCLAEALLSLLQAQSAVEMLLQAAGRARSPVVVRGFGFCCSRARSHARPITSPQIGPFGSVPRYRWRIERDGSALRASSQYHQSPRGLPRWHSTRRNRYPHIPHHSPADRRPFLTGSRELIIITRNSATAVSSRQRRRRGSRATTDKRTTSATCGIEIPRPSPYVARLGGVHPGQCNKKRGF